MTQRRKSRIRVGGPGPILLAICGLIWMAAVAGRAATLTAQLDNDTIALGDTATYSLAFEGVTPDEAPQLPRIPNLSLGATGYSSSFSLINGRPSQTKTFTYALVPQKTGEFVIPAMQVTVGGTTVASTPLKLKVLAANQRAGTETDNAELGFLRIEVSKTNVVEGENFLLETRLYLHPQVQGASDLQLGQLKASGFTVGRTVQSPAQPRVQIGNSQYGVYLFQTVLAAARTGALELGRDDSQLTLQILSNNRRRDVFGFVGRALEGRRVTLTCNTQTVQVTALPLAEAPPGFNGAVGTFGLVVSAAPTNIAVGDPITVKIQIAGRGNVENLAFPAQNHWQQFKVYPPTSRFDTNLNDPLALAGAKTFEVSAVPENTAIKVLPPVVFSFFDPDRKVFATLSNSSIPLIVRPSATLVPPPMIGMNSEAGTNDLAAPELVHIKPLLGPVLAAQSPLIQRPWFMALQLLPVIAWATAGFIRKRQLDATRNPKRLRKLRVQKLVATYLTDLERLSAAGKADEFFATLFRLLQELLGQKLDLPASSITESVVDEHLTRNTGATELTRELSELFHVCNEARYSAQRSARELQAWLPRVRQVVALLETIEDQ